MVKHHTRIRTGVNNHLGIAVKQLCIMLCYGVNMARPAWVKEIASHSQNHQHSGNDR